MPPKSYSFWQWSADSGMTKPFSKEDSQVLEKTYKEYRRATAGGTVTPADGEMHNTVQLTFGGNTFTCDVAAMTQTNDRSKKAVSIARLTGIGNNVKKEEKPAVNNAAKEHYVWEYQTGTTTVSTSSKKEGAEGEEDAEEQEITTTEEKPVFAAYDALTSFKIEAAFNKKGDEKKTTFEIAAFPIAEGKTANIVMNFESMIQTSTPVVAEGEEPTEASELVTLRRTLQKGDAPARFNQRPHQPWNKNGNNKSHQNQTGGAHKSYNNKDGKPAFNRNNKHPDHKGGNTSNNDANKGKKEGQVFNRKFVAAGGNEHQKFEDGDDKEKGAAVGSKRARSPAKEGTTEE